MTDKRHSSSTRRSLRGYEDTDIDGSINRTRRRTAPSISLRGPEYDAETTNTDSTTEFLVDAFGERHAPIPDEPISFTSKTHDTSRNPKRTAAIGSAYLDRGRGIFEQEQDKEHDYNKPSRVNRDALVDFVDMDKGNCAVNYEESLVEFRQADVRQRSRSTTLTAAPDLSQGTRHLPVPGTRKRTASDSKRSLPSPPSAKGSPSPERGVDILQARKNAIARRELQRKAGTESSDNDSNDDASAAVGMHAPRHGQGAGEGSLSRKLTKRDRNAYMAKKSIGQTGGTGARDPNATDPTTDRHRLSPLQSATAESSHSDEGDDEAVGTSGHRDLPAEGCDQPTQVGQADRERAATAVDDDNGLPASPAADAVSSSDGSDVPPPPNAPTDPAQPTAEAGHGTTTPTPGTNGPVPPRASSLRSSTGGGTKGPSRGVSFTDDPPEILSRSSSAQSRVSRGKRVTETSLVRVSSSDDAVIEEMELGAGIVSGTLEDLANAGAVVDSGDDGSDDFDVDQIMWPYNRATLRKALEVKSIATRYFGADNFGTIQFDNFNKAWFVRIKEELDGPEMPKNMVDFVHKCLGYPLPRLLISVTGGALDFELSKELESVLKRGLRRAAEATDAWIVTGGTDCGIMKYVGQAMSEIGNGMIDKDDMGDEPQTIPPVIGLATWGVLRARNVLSRGGVFDSLNDLSMIPASRNSVSLDGNHNVFFLYDNGTEEKFGQETLIRSHFEQAITTTKYHASTTRKLFKNDAVIFSVLLVVEGGPVTLQVVQKSIATRTPVVVIEGSGRVADVISYAWRYLHDTSPEGRYFSIAGLRARIRKLGLMPNEKVLALQQSVLELVLMQSQITIYSLEEDKRDAVLDGVDHALLEAILRSLRIKAILEDTTVPSHQLLLSGLDPHGAGYYDMHQTKLFLALIFNRVDVAHRHLQTLRALVRDVKKNKQAIEAKLLEDLEDALLWSLTDQRTPFVKMLCPLLNSTTLNLHDFLYKDDNRNLAMLFSTRHNRSSRVYLEVLYEKTVQVSRGTLGKHNFKQFRSRTYKNTMERDMTMRRFKGIDMLGVVNRLICNALLGTASKYSTNVLGYRYEESPSEMRLASNVPQKKQKSDRAYQDLMIWAIITGHEDLAVFFWQEGGNSISSAIFASVLLDAIATRSTLARHGYFKDVCRRFLELSHKFEVLAIGVLDECYRENTLMAQRILRLELHHLNLLDKSKVFRNCLELAVYGQKKEFVAHPACLAQIGKEWYGGIDPQNEGLSLFVTALFPPLLIILIHSNSRWCIKMKTEDDSFNPLFSGILNEDSGAPERRPKGRRTGSSFGSPLQDEVDTGPQTRWELGKMRIRMFYAAPVIKFMLDVISFLILVGLYTTILLAPFEDDLDGTTLALVVWMSVMTCEELSQMIASGIGNWWHEHWNKFDAALYVTFWVGFSLKWDATTYGNSQVRWSKIILGLGAMILYIRVFRIYYVSSWVGPKILMLARMMPDIITFLLLFIVMLAMYGVASDAIIYPAGDEWSASRAGRIIYHPYFQVFGELFLDDIQANTECLGPDPWSNCGISLQEFIPALAAIYLLFTNIVLVNLLIAMMARTYEKVEADSIKHWNFQKYDLLLEYQEKSMWPTPFSAFEHFYSIISAMCMKAQTSFGGGRSSPDDETRGTSKEAKIKRDKTMKAKELYRTLESFQEKNTERYADKMELASLTTDSVRLERLEESHSVAANMMRELHTQTQRLDLCMLRTFEAIDEMREYLGVQTMELFTRIANVKVLAKQRGRIESSLDTPRQGSSQSSQDRDEDVSDEDTASEEDPLVTLKRTKYDNDVLQRLTKRRYHAVDVDFYSPMLSAVMYAMSPDRIVGFWRGRRPMMQEDFHRQETQRHGTIFYALQDDEAKSHADKHLITLFESELDYFIGNKDVDNSVAACPRLVNGDEARRVDVPADVLSWDVEWPEYDPPEYTAPYVLHFGPDSPSKFFKWAHPENVSDAIKKGLIAESATNTPIIVDGVPRNPFGRTGLRGRGLLGKWGPNQATDQIVTRWKRNNRYMQIERRGKPVLEVVLCKRKQGGEWSLPGSFALKDGVNPLIRKAFGLDAKSLEENEDLQEVEQILKTSQVFYHGQTCDARDTDNAWVESKIVHVHDNTGILSKYEMTESIDPGVEFVSWGVVHHDIKLFANHAKVLENLAKKMNAYW
eukprot:m.1618112 g.1618112  ORF g.1618112 m.1618112 type:complete len:2175 (-) comp25376_c1_seq2:5314-11838(-)